MVKYGNKMRLAVLVQVMTIETVRVGLYQIVIKDEILINMLLIIAIDMAP